MFADALDVATGINSSACLDADKSFAFFFSARRMLAAVGPASFDSVLSSHWMSSSDFWSKTDIDSDAIVICQGRHDFQIDSSRVGTESL